MKSEIANYSNGTSPQVYARLGGVLYLIIIVGGIFGELFVRGTLVAWGDPTATANNIIGSQLLWRIGIAGDLIMYVSDVGLMLVFYRLLRPVNKDLALLALLFHLIQTVVLIANKIILLIPLLLLADADYLKALDPSQLHTLAYLSIKLHACGLSVGLIFFGFACLLYGRLIYKSGYLPRFLGILMHIAGLAYLTDSFAVLVAPTFDAMISPGVLIPALIAELTLCLWLHREGRRCPEMESTHGAGCRNARGRRLTTQAEAA